MVDVMMMMLLLLGGGVVMVVVVVVVVTLTLTQWREQRRWRESCGWWYK
mgnify:CR=1 FL=1